MFCGCTVTLPDDWQIQAGNTLTFDVGRIIIEFCPLHAAAGDLRDAIENFIGSFAVYSKWTVPELQEPFQQLIDALKATETPRGEEHV